MATPLHMNTCPEGHETYNLSRLFIGHHYNLLSLSDLCLRLERKIFFLEIYNLYGHALAQKNPVPGVLIFTI